MRRFARDYGLIIVLIAIGVVGYAIFQNNKRAILSSSLDVIRDRLVAMIDDVSNRQTAAQHFEEFEAKVLAQEIDPDDVENVAANVLNLSNSGSSVTLEQVALMLDVAASSAPEVVLLPSPATPADSAETPPLAAVAPTPPTPSEPPTAAPVDLDALGERLESMLAFDAEAWRAVNEQHVEDAMAQHIRYRVDGDLHIDLDENLPEALKKRLERQAERVAEHEKMIVVRRQNMAEELRAERERAHVAWRSVVALRKRPSPAVRVDVDRLESLESLKELETIGYRALLNDSIRHEIEVQIEGALEALAVDLEIAIEEQDLDAEQHMEQLEELEDLLEDMLDDIEEAVEEAEEAQEEDDDESFSN